MLIQFASDTMYHFLLIFVRLGTALMFLPGIGEIYVTPRFRLVAALILSAATLPIIAPLLPANPGSALALGIVLVAEATTGIFIGMIGRMLQSTLHIAGMIVAFQSSLASALLFDATQGSQGSVIGNFITLVGITLLFTTDLHHVMLAGIIESYGLFAPGKFLQAGDMAEFSARTLSDGFLVAFKMASPLVVVGLCLYLIAGIASRLMPAMQVFFVIVPAQILVSFFILLLTLSSAMMWYLDFFENTMRTFLGQ